jgi:hypothetical protein
VSGRATPVSSPIAKNAKIAPASLPAYEAVAEDLIDRE